MNTIKQLRKEKGLTQVQLAEILNIDQTTISKWELNRATPDTQILIRLSKYFDVSTDFLLGLSTLYYPDRIKANAVPSLSSEEQHLLDTFRKLNMKNRMHVSTYADIRLEDQDTRNTGNFA